MRRSRMLGWDRNPLRRRIDRVEAAMVAGVIAVFLISAPALAAVAGHWIGSAGMRQQRAEAAWRMVPATVLGSAQGQIPSGPAGTVWMLARWTAPDGQVRRDWIPVSPGDAADGRSRRPGWAPLPNRHLFLHLIVLLGQRGARGSQGPRGRWRRRPASRGPLPASPPRSQKRGDPDVRSLLAWFAHGGPGITCG